MKINVPYIEQMEHSECGLACVAMVLNYNKHHVTLTELRDEFGLSKNGGSLYHLLMIGQSKGLIGKAFQIEAESLKELTLPLILHWDNNHFVVLEGFKKNKFNIVDPSFGKRSYDLNEFKEHFTRTVLSLVPSDEFEKKKKESTVPFFFDIIKKQKKLVILTMFFSLVLQLTAITIPLTTKWFTDSVLIKGEISYLSIVGFAVFGVFLLNLILTTLRGMVIAKIQTKLDSQLMSTFISKLFHLPYNFFETRTSGELIFRSNLNIYIRQILSTNVVSFFIDIILLFTYIAIMFYYSVSMTLIVILVGFLVFAILLLNSRLLKNLSDKQISEQADVQSYLSEKIYGISDVKMMGLESMVFKNWKEKFNLQLQTAEKMSIWTSSLVAISTSIQFILPLFLLWLGATFIIQGEMTIGTLLAFNSMAAAFIIPIISLITTYTDLINLSSYIQRLMDVIKAKSEQEQVGIDKKIGGKIEICNVSYAYDSFSENILENISVTIEKGEFVAIVGPSGSGKSTLVRLILGLYKPIEGQVLYDNTDIQECDLIKMRKQIGAVLQESRLFNETILDNIIMSNDENIDYVEEALRKAEVLDLVKNLPLGIYTKISEGGVNFSGGQRQRLIIARALVKQPKVLVLDEATSALDNITEERIEKNLNELLNTRIMIAHRLSTIINADKIIVLDKGKIVEIGDHYSLLKNNGLYSKLYSYQNNSIGKNKLVNNT